VGDLIAFLGAMFGGERESNLVLLKVTLAILAIAAAILLVVVLLE
jgi:hypothetical protein